MPVCHDVCRVEDVDLNTCASGPLSVEEGEKNPYSKNAVLSSQRVWLSLCLKVNRNICTFLHYYHHPLLSLDKNLKLLEKQ